MLKTRNTYRKASGSRLEVTRWFYQVMILFTVAISALLVTADAGAVNGKLKQQIFPLDCIFEVVNDGTGTIIYHTPEECGQIPEPEPEPEPEPVNRTPTPAIPGIVTVVDNGIRVRIVEAPVTPVENEPTPPVTPGSSVEASQATPNTNEIIVSWKVPSGYSFKEFSIQVRRVGTLAWKLVATAAENRRSTIITLGEGEYDIRVLGIPTNPDDEPVVLGVTRVIVEYVPANQVKSPDYTWIWIIITLLLASALWWSLFKRNKRRQS